MATVRGWLDDAGVNWSNLVIVAQTYSNSKYPGWGTAQESYKFDFRGDANPACDLVKALLDHEFDNGSGAPQAPRFIADDGEFLYFPEQDNGATSLVRICKNIEYYLDIENETPYPGN